MMDWRLLCLLASVARVSPLNLRSSETNNVVGDDKERRLLFQTCPLMTPREECPGANRVPACPPTYNQSSIDIRFVDDASCGYSCQSRCCFFHQGASACTRSIPKGISAGQQCCYDDNFLLIAQAENGAGGTFDCTSPPAPGVGFFKSTISTVLHWKEDVLPFILCCQLLGYSSATCISYYDERPVDDGSSYVAPS